MTIFNSYVIQHETTVQAFNQHFSNGQPACYLVGGFHHLKI